MTNQAPKPLALWKLVILTILLFVLINFVFETAVALANYDIENYYPLTRIVILLLTTAGVKLYRNRKAKVAQ